MSTNSTYEFIDASRISLINGGFIGDANDNEALIIVTTASAINEFTLTPAAVSGSPQLATTGGDTNINMTLNAKGTGAVNITHSGTRVNLNVFGSGQGGMAFVSNSIDAFFSSNSRFDGSNWVAVATGPAAAFGNLTSGDIALYTAASQTAGGNHAMSQRFGISNSTGRCSCLAGLDVTGTVTATLPVVLPTYTVATLPSAATYARGLIYVSDGTSNKRLAVSDATNWRWPDGAVVT